MADLLAQFDIVERAEQARARRAEGGPGVGRPREPPVNPFDEEEELNLMPSPLEVSGARLPARHGNSLLLYSMLQARGRGFWSRDQGRVCVREREIGGRCYKHD